MEPIKIAKISEQNCQSESPTRKPNEDFAGYVYKYNALVAVVMDGIPVLRDEHGNYPEENGAIASRIAVEKICHLSQWARPPQSFNLFNLRLAFRLANRGIKDENQARLVYEKKEPQWMATVGCALWVNMLTSEAYFAYIGDPLAFLISPRREARLLTEDQLRPFEQHLFTCHKDELTKDPGTIAYIREHQDKFIRNVMDAQCYCGEPLCGWGALTGQSEAMEFVGVETFQVPPGTRVILASDAIEAIGKGNAQERNVADYLPAFQAISGLEPQEAVEELLRLTRAGEVEKKCKSDDASFIVVDF